MRKPKANLGLFNLVARPDEKQREQRKNDASKKIPHQ